MFIVVFVVMLPVYLKTKDAVQAWSAGLAWAFMIGVIVMIGAFVGPYIRKLTPRAAMLGTLAGISITFISMRPAAQMWEAAWIGLPVMAIILIGFFTDLKLPFGIPVGLAALSGRHGDRLVRRIHVGPDVGGDQRHRDRDSHLRVNSRCGPGCRNLAPLLGTAIPLGVYNFPEAMSNVESAAAAGDNYNLRSVLLADGAGAIIGSAFGSPFPPAVYIGHPGWKEAGGRAGYDRRPAVRDRIVVFPRAFRGTRRALLPMPAIVPILLYIGLLIGAQAFQATPRLHAVAVVAALLPNLARGPAG